MLAGDKWMTLTIAYLGPVGTYSETAVLAYANSLSPQPQQLTPYPSIALALRSVVQNQADLAVVPVENSTEGSVVMTLDALWQLPGLKIQQELVLPISHALLSRGQSLTEIKTVYSHPQALAQCQKWLENNLPTVPIIPTNSTAEAIQILDREPNSAAIASPRAAKIYNVPILIEPINDYPDNCTRFWVMALSSHPEGERMSLAFQVVDQPGALVKPLEVFAKRQLNLSRIESRPTKRSLGEYVFFIDIEINQEQQHFTAEALEELKNYTDAIEVFGAYQVVNLPAETLEKL
jgi:prephenate dehydratase